ncbi:MAG: TIGR00282 family metallophosphoesterase [Spirochaetia bacterium]
MLKVILLGDIVGQAALHAVLVSLSEIKKNYQANFLIINAENTNEGFGLLPEQAQQLFHAGIDVITTGNHIWQRQEIFAMLDQHDRLLRPENYPPGSPGHGFVVVPYHDYKIGVINIQGRIRMGHIVDCPFRSIKQILKNMRQITPIIFVDFHAEDTAEKQALGYYIDGKVSGIVGTHTHVQTMDEKILPKGTGYLTDLGLSGSYSGIIGSQIEGSLTRYLTQLPSRSTPSSEELVIQGVCMHIQPDSGQCIKIERIHHTI